MAAYYNEIDRFAAAWLRELIKAGHIAPGDVDERDIRDVRPTELVGYRQCHFFAGVGVWSYALRLAGWPDDRPVWTGSCPCQPFSAAGRGDGFADERHLWPHWFHLIRFGKPCTVLGEQVASPDGISWLELVSSDLEAEGYAFGSKDLCAAGFGAPHIRQRLYFVADSNGARRTEGNCAARPHATEVFAGQSSENVGVMADSASGRSWAGLCDSEQGEQRRVLVADDSELGDSNQSIPQGRSLRLGKGAGELPLGASGAVNGFWRDAEWLYCRDEKYRPVEPGTFPLASGATNRVGRLRGYGNAINAEVAKEFIAAYMEICNEPA